MVDNEDELSDDESLSDAWSVDFFDVEDAVPLLNLDINLNSRTRFADLPESILHKIIEPLGLQDRMRICRCNDALKKAVASSKWTLAGDGRLIVSAEWGEEGLEDLSISFGGSFQCVKLGKRISLVPRCNPCSSLYFENDARKLFDWLHGLFSELHLKELRLENVPLMTNELAPFNKFIDDGCSFDRLTIPLQCAQFMDKKLHNLINRAKKEVVIEMDMLLLSGEQLLAFERPVKFILNKSFYHELSEKLLMDLVLLGHSLINFSGHLSSVSHMKALIETVSSSPIDQKVNIGGLDYETCDNYVMTFAATMTTTVFRDPRCKPYEVLVKEGVNIQAYKHGNATICLIKRNEEKREGRITVTSNNYPEQEETVASHTSSTGIHKKIDLGMRYLSKINK